MTQLLPVYYQIKHAIKNWIISGDFKPGQKIPSENELANRFNVSRLTVRQATYQLAQEGFLNSRRGEGTFVTTNESLINSFSLEFSGFMDDLFYKVSKVKAKSVEIARMVAPKLVREKLELPDDNQEVINIKRVRLLGDRIFSYTTNYLPLEIGLKIDERELLKKPLLQIIEQDLHIEFTEAIEIIQASFADQHLAERLGISPGLPILYLERTMYTKGMKPVEFVQSSHPGDLFKYIVRLRNVKRKHGSFWVHSNVSSDKERPAM